MSLSETLTFAAYLPVFSQNEVEIKKGSRETDNFFFSLRPFIGTRRISYSPNVTGTSGSVLDDGIAHALDFS